MNSFWRIDDYTFADFIWYLIKNRKIHVFRNPRSNVKHVRILERWWIIMDADNDEMILLARASRQLQTG